MNEGKRFSVYFYADQLEYMDKEAERLGVSRSKYIEMKTLPKELQKLEHRRGAKKLEREAD